MTATSSKDGEFETSTTTWAPLSTWPNPSPVSVLTPELGDAATASCPRALSFVTSLDPIRPLPPITTIFILIPLSVSRQKPSKLPVTFRYLLRLDSSLSYDMKFLRTLYPG